MDVALSKKEGSFILKFTQPPLGGYLTTIVKNELCWDDISNDVNRHPGIIARIIFRLTSGLSGFTLKYSLTGDESQHNSARFYFCKDRRSRERILAQLSDKSGMAGGYFILYEQDFLNLIKHIET